MYEMRDGIVYLILLLNTEVITTDNYDDKFKNINLKNAYRYQHLPNNYRLSNYSA